MQRLSITLLPLESASSRKRKWVLVWLHCQVTFLLLLPLFVLGGTRFL